MSRRIYEISVTGEMDTSLRNAFEDVELTVDHSVTRMRVVSPDSNAQVLAVSVRRRNAFD